MGRKTFESMGSKALPNRLNIVLSQNQKISETSDTKQAGSLSDALQLASHLNPKSRVFVIGGASIYEQALSDCRMIY